MNVLMFPRPTDRPEVHHEGHGPFAADRPAPVLRHPHVRHNRTGILQRKTSPLLHTHTRHPGYKLPLHCEITSVNLAVYKWNQNGLVWVHLVQFVRVNKPQETVFYSDFRTIKGCC